MPDRLLCVSETNCEGDEDGEAEEAGEDEGEEDAQEDVSNELSSIPESLAEAMVAAADARAASSAAAAAEVPDMSRGDEVSSGGEEAAAGTCIGGAPHASGSQTTKLGAGGLRRSVLKRTAADASSPPQGISPPPLMGVSHTSPDTVGAGRGSPGDGHPKRARALPGSANNSTSSGTPAPTGIAKTRLIFGPGSTTSANLDALSREAAASRAVRFERPFIPAAIAPGARGAAAAPTSFSSSCDLAVRAAGVEFDWYIPPPYSWSALSFPPSRDEGADGRNFADGGGWGRCSEMCPSEEVHERLHIAPNANLQETDPLTGEPDAAWLVTMFHRNDAARVWKPTDIRNISALANSVEHLLTVVLPRRFPAFPGGPCPTEAAAWENAGDTASIGWEGVKGEPPFIRTASFVRDRLRQVRQELTMQQPSFSLAAREVAVDLLEQCTRFHIMVEHRCCELGLRNLPPDDAKFDSRMNMQMYTQALSGLQQLYEELRHHGVQCANEAEFQAYYLVSSADPDVLFGRLASLPAEVLSDPCMQIALRVVAAIQGGDFGAFFRELKRASYLTACLMHKHFETVRQRAVVAINRAFAPRPDSKVELPLADFQRMLRLEDAEEAKAIADFYGLNLSPSGTAVLLTGTSRIYPKTDAEGAPILPPLVCSRSIIEAKREGIPVCQLMMSPKPPPKLVELVGGVPAVAATTLPSPRAMIASVAAKQAGGSNSTSAGVTTFPLRPAASTSASKPSGAPSAAFPCAGAVVTNSFPPANVCEGAPKRTLSSSEPSWGSAPGAVFGFSKAATATSGGTPLPTSKSPPTASHRAPGPTASTPFTSDTSKSTFDQSSANVAALGPSAPTAFPVAATSTLQLSAAAAAFTPSTTTFTGAIPATLSQAPAGAAISLPAPAVAPFTAASFIIGAAPVPAPSLPTILAAPAPALVALSSTAPGVPGTTIANTTAASGPFAPSFVPSTTSPFVAEKSPPTTTGPQSSTSACLATATPVTFSFGGERPAPTFVFPSSPEESPAKPVWSMTLDDDEVRVDAPLARARGRATAEICFEMEVEMVEKLVHEVANEAVGDRYALWIDDAHGRKEFRHPAWLDRIAAANSADLGSRQHMASQLPVLKLRFSHWATATNAGRERRAAFGAKRRKQRDASTSGTWPLGGGAEFGGPCANTPLSMRHIPMATWGGGAARILELAGERADPARTTTQAASRPLEVRSTKPMPCTPISASGQAPFGIAPIRSSPARNEARVIELHPILRSNVVPTSFRPLGWWWAKPDPFSPRAIGTSPVGGATSRASLDGGLGMRDFDEVDDDADGIHRPASSGFSFPGESFLSSDEVRESIASASQALTSASFSLTAPLLEAVRAAKKQMVAVAISLGGAASDTYESTRAHVTTPRPSPTSASISSPIPSTRYVAPGIACGERQDLVHQKDSRNAVAQASIGDAPARVPCVNIDQEMDEADRNGDDSVVKLLALARAARREREALADKITRAQRIVARTR